MSQRPSSYKTYDYGSIPICDIADTDKCNLLQLANVTVRELCENRNMNLLMFPSKLDAYKDGVADSNIFTIDEQKLQTGDLLGFIGINDTQLTISSRFAENDTKDYFLHYMLQKVFNINLLNLRHSASNDSVFDFLVYMFPFYLKRALKQGVFRLYKNTGYNNANVRGTINIPEHIKYNIPFSGKIAYRVKEYSEDNCLTQLIRHTIEYIRTSEMSSILKIDAESEACTSQICNVTPSYNRNALNTIIAKNLKPVCHPFYTEYGILQKLCIYILQHKRLRYGTENSRVYGLLFSGSWLWEEFLYKAVLKECGFRHPQNKAGKGGIYLFESNAFYNDNFLSRCKRYPDYITEGCILDAKYKHLDNNHIDRNDMHQIISYMHVEKAKIGGFIYPTSRANLAVTKLGTLRGHGGYVYNIGVPVPQKVGTYQNYVDAMNRIQDDLKSVITKFIDDTTHILP